MLADAAFDPDSANFEDELAHAFASSHTNDHDAPQVVVEATGFPEAILTSFRIAGWMARVVLLGSTRGNASGVDFYRDVHKKGLTLLGAHIHTVPTSDSAARLWTWRANVRTVLRFIVAGRLNVQPLITHRVPAESAPSIYAEITQWNPSVLGALLLWQT